jgi:hypothetical protein
MFEVFYSIFKALLLGSSSLSPDYLHQIYVTLALTFPPLSSFATPSLLLHQIIPGGPF